MYDKKPLTVKYVLTGESPDQGGDEGSDTCELTASAGHKKWTGQGHILIAKADVNALRQEGIQEIIVYI